MEKQIETRLRFTEALNRLMEEESLDRAKVSHLCDLAGLSRATFYDYFHDIFDVAVWYWDYLMEQSLYRMGLDQSCYEGHLRKFKLLLANKEFFVNAFKSTNYNSVCEHGGRTSKHHIIDQAERNAGRRLTDWELLEIEFYNTGAQYMTRNWVRGGMSRSAEEMTQLFQNFTPAFLVDMLEPSEASLEAPASSNRDA
ncbi:TetR/AcrR family transcriptional regulator [Adlercreutzia shanghongiae]|uniref:TetR/AcrR family transcriptional regulator n=1 Tax=Adlercreutzia shanghongiae TaxID=3111773 RepID=A0ABU6IZ67_9ACTN|nr:TetR/AcrR family transcriptional regulator [Adlercreutzia sp. R22]MEC4295128.1 TetR/AcrR family transcriptional regulator [Adlercreutzia sp. R22]